MGAAPREETGRLVDALIERLGQPGASVGEFVRSCLLVARVGRTTATNGGC